MKGATDRAYLDAMSEHGALLSRIASSYESDRHRREDLLQDIALAVWRALPTWKGESSLRTFLARIAHNRGISHSLGRPTRDAGSDLLESVVDEAAGPEQSTAMLQDRERLLDAVRRLPIGLRQAITLMLEDFSSSEIAEILGISTGAVDVRLTRARQLLRKLLEKQDD